MSGKSGFTVGASRFRPSKWLKKAGYAPQVFVFRDLESGQVLYSQLPTFTQTQIDAQFPRPNWANKKPPTRRDIWKCMCVVDMGDHDSCVKLYQNLCRLRYLRDVSYAKEAQAMRKKNEFGQTWYSGQYRPTFTQEAVADLRESLLKMKQNNPEKTLENTTIHWEDEWRMGDKSKHWTPVLEEVKHDVLLRTGNLAREESAILRELATARK